MSVVKNKNGRTWDAWFYVKDETGQLRKVAKKGFATKKEATEYERIHKNESRSFRKTFMDVFEESNRANQASDLTISTRRQRLIDYASNIVDMPIERVTKNILLEWRDELSTTSLSTATKNYIIGVVKQVFSYASDVYDMRDPSRILRTFPKTLDDMQEMNIITYEQFSKIQEYENDDVLKTFFQFLFMTGCRKGEARALLKDDYSDGCIKINKSMRRYEDSVKTTKNKSSRLVRLDDDTARKIEILAQRSGKYLFGDYSPLSLTTISAHFNRNLKLANMPHIRIHDLRHSNVSMLWAANVPIPEISKRIGHKNPKITMEIYAHMLDNSQQNSVDFLNSLKK